MTKLTVVWSVSINRVFKCAKPPFYLFIITNNYCLAVHPISCFSKKKSLNAILLNLVYRYTKQDTNVYNFELSPFLLGWSF